MALRIKAISVLVQDGSKIIEDPSSPIKDKDGKGIIGLGSNGNKFYTIEFEDAEDIMSQSRTRNIFSAKRGDGTEYWPRLSPTQAIANKERVVKGSLVTANVPEYEVPGRDGQPSRKVSTYTAVVFNDETAEQVFTRAKHPMLQGAPSATTVVVNERAAAHEVEAY